MGIRIDSLLSILRVAVFDKREGDVLALLLDVHAVDRAELFELIPELKLGGLESTYTLHLGSDSKRRSSYWVENAQRFCLWIWTLTLTTSFKKY